MSSSSDKHSILVIEDEPGIRENLCDVLVLEGYEVASAANGVDGCVKAKELLPDLVICDVMMPEMDGFGVLQNLRDHEPTSTIPFMFLSARYERIDMRSGLGLGADDYLTKPVDIEELLSSVKMRIDRASAHKRKAEQEQVEQWGSLPHEINTPLNGIISSSELYLSMIRAGEPVSTEELADVFEIILDSGYRLHRFTDKYIRYFELVQQIKAPNTRVFPETLAVAGLVQESSRDMMRQFDRENDMQVDLQDAAVLGLRFWIGQSLNNLLENAFKFSELGAPVNLVGRVAGEHYCLEIIDQGRGMTDKQIADVGPFKQFDRDKFEQQGFGLGLFNAREGIYLSGGTFELSHAQPQGLRVRITLPLAQ